MEIADVQSAVRIGSVRITDHADEGARNDNLSYDEIMFSVLMGKIIEDYPDDNTVWAYNEQTKYAVLITVYRPDPSRWINWQRRK